MISLRFAISLIVEMPKINEYGYAESSSNTRITTKDTKKEWPCDLSLLRALRGLRGEITYEPI